MSLNAYRRLINSAIIFSVFITLGCDTKPLSGQASHVQDQQETVEKHVFPIEDAFYHASASELKANFKQPPDQVKPWVYWYWISDNVSKQGIEDDLLAMQKAGIGTALIGIIHLQGKQGQVKSLTDEWWDHVTFAIKKAAQYKIDIGLFNSPGWSQSGGPWVTLDKSMRYLDAQEYQVLGSQTVTLDFDEPDSFFQDVRVIAFKTPEFEREKLTSDNARVTLTDSVTDTELSEQPIQALFDGNLGTPFILSKALLSQKRYNAGGDGALQIDFVRPESFEARTLEIYPHNSFATQGILSAKNQAGLFEVIKTFDVQRPRNMPAIGPDHDAPIVVTFPVVDSRHFRLSFEGFNMGRKKDLNEDIGFKEIVLSKGYKLERYPEKKLAKVFPKPMPKFDSYAWPMSTKTDNPALLLESADVLDITEHAQNGRLNWQVPAGDWTIVRYFMRPTGTQNGPSSHAAKGPEIDKLSRPIAEFHFDAYIGKILESMQPEDRTALKYAVVDSYEKGAQNWTDGFAETFAKRYGYDPIPFLPVYSGRVVNSVSQSERFLWDVRRLVADGVSHEYAAALRERANKHGLKLWLENYGHWGFPAEFLQYGGQADIVSGEFWATGDLGAIELKAASSAAHIYGHKTVMSESFTAGRNTRFKHHPWDFKKRGDWSFVEGVNHTLLHVYIHQAYGDRFPGVNAWFGSEFNRNNTWFPFMDNWLAYIKRSNYMMQQGKYIADVMYFIGEDAPKMTGEISPELPKGYSYDFINAEVILERLTFNQGKYRLPDGMTFELLVLPNLDSMRPAVLQKIQQLVKQGGAVYGPKPMRSPSLEGYPKADLEVQKIADALWQNIDGLEVTQAEYGQGKIFYIQQTEQNIPDLAQILDQIGTPADLLDLPDEVIWSHRSSHTHDIYFIANQSEQSVDITPSFRVGATQPQRWDPVTGKTYDIAQFEFMRDTQHGPRTTIPMKLNGLESSFFVFEKPNASDHKPALSKDNILSMTKQGKPVWLPSAFNGQGQRVITLTDNASYAFNSKDGGIHKTKIDDIPASLTLNQTWEVSFQEGRDVPSSLLLDNLRSLTELDSVALQHYSGTITYQTEFVLGDEMLVAQQSLQLNLGEVGVIAKVKLNGHDLGALWSRPLTADITEFVKLGTNTLEVQVATTWLNRLLGDHKYPEKFPDQKQNKQFNTDVTFAMGLTKDTQLQPSGLIGPVTIQPLRQYVF